MKFLVLKCGSAARGDTNELSDIDFVCLHEDGNFPFRSLARKYPGISFYSRSSIDRMKSHGALFLTHIDVDGSPIQGEMRILDWVKDFRPPKKTVLQAASDTKNFIGEIEWLPNSTKGQLWLCDILFVALRNYLYCANAANGIYHFGLESAISAFGLPDRYLNVFLELRQGKYRYRLPQDKKQHAIKRDFYLIAAELAEQVTGEAMQIVLGGKTDWSADWRLDYWGERLLERAIINNEIEDDGYLAMLSRHNYHRRALVKELLNRVKSAQQDLATHSSRFGLGSD